MQDEGRGGDVLGFRDELWGVDISDITVQPGRTKDTDRVIEVQQPHVDKVTYAEPSVRNEEFVYGCCDQVCPLHIRDRTLDRARKQPDQAVPAAGEHRRSRVVRQKVLQVNDARLILAYRSH
jgi:hypothetical protein